MEHTVDQFRRRKTRATNTKEHTHEEAKTQHTNFGERESSNNKHTRIDKEMAYITHKSGAGERNRIASIAEETRERGNK